MPYYFPFGKQLHPLVQEDTSPKKVFVLGVYASAVHARWKKDGQILCQALAVASEPRIFWDGDPAEAKNIIDSISIPPELGTLEPAGRQLNGPSAKVLDENILAPLGCIEITGSMVRNYVKKGLVANPVQKRYYANQIAYLISVFILKSVMPLENIQALFFMQKKVYSDQVAYDYLCMELENVLQYHYGLKPEIEHIGRTNSVEKQMLRSAIIAVCNVIYLNGCFRMLSQEERQ